MTMTHEQICGPPTNLSESFHASASDYRSEFLKTAATVREMGEADYHELLLDYFPAACRRITNEYVPRSTLLGGVWYTDPHFFSRRSDAASIVEGLHLTLDAASFCVSVGDEWDFAWSEVADPIGKAVAWKRKIAERYPHCHFHSVLGNHDGDDEYFERLLAVAKELPNVSVHKYAVKVGRYLFTHGDCVHWEHADTDKVDSYRRSYNDGWKPGLVDKAIDRIAIAFNLHALVPRHLLELLIPRERQAERLLQFLHKLDPELLRDVRNICFGHTHKEFSAFEHASFRFFNGGCSERGSIPKLHHFVVKTQAESEADFLSSDRGSSTLQVA